MTSDYDQAQRWDQLPQFDLSLIFFSLLYT